MLRYHYFPEIRFLDHESIPVDVWKSLHNWETEIVEAKLALRSTAPDFQQEEAFLAGKLAVLQEILAYSPFKEVK